MKEFRAIVEQEEEKGDWYVQTHRLRRHACSEMYSRGFKALKQSTKLLYLTLRRPQDALKTYTELLTYTKSAVTRNYSEKSINGILDYVGGAKGGPVDVNTLEQFYQATKKALQEARNEVNCGVSSPTSNPYACNLLAIVCQDKSQVGQTLARSSRVHSLAKGMLATVRQFDRRSWIFS